MMIVKLIAIAIIIVGVFVARSRAAQYPHEDGVFDERAGVFIFWLALFTFAAIALVGVTALLS